MLHNALTSADRAYLLLFVVLWATSSDAVGLSVWKQWMKLGYKCVITKLNFSLTQTCTWSISCLTHTMPQSTMSCNHVISDLLDFGCLNKKKKKKRKEENKSGIWKSKVQVVTQTFAVDPPIIYFMEQAVDTRLRKEFLHLHVCEDIACSGQWIYFTPIPCVFVMFSISVCTLYKWLVHCRI